jgi:predicted DNA-binding transcriptional regulator AlpA
MDVADLITRKRIVELTGASTSQVLKITNTTGFPVPVKHIRPLAWDRQAVIEWLEANPVKTIADRNASQKRENKFVSIHKKIALRRRELAKHIIENMDGDDIMRYSPRSIAEYILENIDHIETLAKS